MKQLLLFCLAILTAPVAHGQNGHAGDPSWPGVWGPQRDGNAHAAGSPRQPTGFKELWRRKTQGGYSEIVVTPRAAVTMEARNGTDDVVAFDRDSGRELWRTTVGATYRGHDGSHDGPIATPAVDGNDVYATGPHGVLVSLDVSNGRERWRHDLVKEFGAAPLIYGFSSSPLIDGTTVIVQTGGEKSRGLLAFDRATGNLRWNAAHGLRGGYSSPALGEIAGTRQVVASSGDLVYGVSPADGRLLWSVPGPGDPEGVANPPQLLGDDRVLITFWTEAVLLTITRHGDAFTAAETWRSPRLRSAYSPTIYRDGHLFGFNGPFLTCLEIATGETKWRHRLYEGTIVGLGTNLLVLGRTSGLIHIVATSPSAFTEVARSTVLAPGSTSMTGPSAAGGRVFVRNSEEIVALAIEGR